MKNRVRGPALVTLTSVLGVLTAFVPGTAHAAVDHVVGWYGYAGSSAVADAVAESLVQGNTVADASALAGNLATVADASTGAFIRDQLSNYDDGATVQNLLGHAATGADAVAPSDGAATTAAPMSTATTASAPAQATHGQPTATSLYSWILHNSEPTRIYYGTCDFWDNTCTTGGFINVTETSNTYYTNEAYFSLAIREGAGLHASFSGHQVRTFQDITGSTDPSKTNLGCSTSGYNALDCSGNTSPPNSTGNWYYYREDFRLTYGANYVNVQIQTRRWDVVASYNWQFIAYNYGG